MPVVTGVDVSVEVSFWLMAFGFAVTSGAASSGLTVTLTVFEVMVVGTVELSVTLSSKLHVPVGVDVVVENV